MKVLNKYDLQNDYDFEIEVKLIIEGFYYKIRSDVEGRVSTFTSGFFRLLNR